MVGPADSGYPRRLRMLSYAPKHIYMLGTWQDHERAVAIVGARAAETDAVALARALACELATAGAMILSGGAVGIDTAAHQGALDARDRAAGDHEPGTTVAVLGCGVDVAYPERNRQLFDDIRAAGGALLSELLPGTPPRAWHLARRNRIIAGMADAVVVVAAGARSGALQTARAARRLGRVVCAVPGTPGCEGLIATGAAVVHQAADVLRALDGLPVRPVVPLPEPDSHAGRVLALLDERHALDHDEIAARTGLGVREVARALTNLELQGLAIALPGSNYMRSGLAQELLAR